MGIQGAGKKKQQPQVGIEQEAAPPAKGEVVGRPNADPKAAIAEAMKKARAIDQQRGDRPQMAPTQQVQVNMGVPVSEVGKGEVPSTGKSTKKKDQPKLTSPTEEPKKKNNSLDL